MKQHITKKQWEELSENEKNIMDKFICHSIKNGFSGRIDSIIEFLGDDIDSITLMNRHWTLILIDETHFTDKELINVGWEAAKYKLR